MVSRLPDLEAKGSPNAVKIIICEVVLPSCGPASQNRSMSRKLLDP